MKEYYNKIAGGYNELYGSEQLAKWEIAKKIIDFSKKDRVLDVGCGTGIVTTRIANRVNFVIGLDYSESMIKHAKKKENIQYVIGNAKRLPFEDKAFDKVVSFTMIQDIRNWKDVIHEMKRVCKGDILLTVQKRNKTPALIKKRLGNCCKVKKFVEQEKDFILLLSSK